MKKYFAPFFFALLLLSSLLFVFWNVVWFSENTKIGWIVSKNIFFWSNTLNRTIIIYKSDSDISKYSVKNKDTKCKTLSNYLWTKKWLYFFEITFLDDLCINPSFSLFNETTNEISDSSFTLRYYKNYDIYNSFLDLDSQTLSKALVWIDDKINKLSLYNYLKAKDIPESIIFLIKKREYEESIFKKEILTHIIEGRKNKYIIPIEWYELPTKKDKLPNAGRWYRSGYTDGIHHSWDIDTELWTWVLSLDDWIVVRVVNNWSWASLSNVRKWETLSEDDLIRNLDILRGNQVWIKTLKWELVMYNHLDAVSDTMYEWAVIKKWTPIWTVWVSWVPEEGYNDFHLDFSISENPYTIKKAGKYDIVDYMKWDWKMKDKSTEYIIENQYIVFEKK